MVQGELFREENYNPNPFESDPKKSFLSRHQLTITLDKLLLGWIAMMVVFVLTYSFGVEHGKRAVEKRLESVLLTHSETVDPRTAQTDDPTDLLTAPKQETVLIIKDIRDRAPALTPRDPVTEEETPGADQDEAERSPLPSPDLARQAKYTLQLVTYTDQHTALKELDRLKTKGHEGFVIPSGRYFQVCANYFDTTSKARNVLKELRGTGRYPDAFVRPIVRQTP